MKMNNSDLMRPPRLFIFAGLPGTGKTTLAKFLARELRATYLRIDTIEQAMRDEQMTLAGPEGYVIAYRLAADNLRLGMSVVADSVNPIRISRRAWRDAATQAGVPFVEIEVICSDVAEHRRRVECRRGDIAGHRQPTWEEVRERQQDPWDTTPVVIDTAGQTESQSCMTLQRLLEASDNPISSTDRLPG